MKAPNKMCDNVCQFAASLFSTEPMSFIAIVDIGTAAFLTVTGFFLRLMAGARRRHRARLITYRPKCPYPVTAARLASKGARSSATVTRQRRNVRAVIKRTPAVSISISAAPKSLIVCKGTSQVP